MFNLTAGEKLVDLLFEWEVNHIFWMSGDSINSIMEPLRKAQDKKLWVPDTAYRRTYFLILILLLFKNAVKFHPLRFFLEVFYDLTVLVGSNLIDELIL
jgi:hypothetical protein